MGSTTAVNVVVTSQCGVAKTYTLNVARGTCNANNSLSGLTTSAGSWNTPFASGTFDYDVNEAWNVTSVDIVATVAAGTSSVTINGIAGATRTITLGAQGSTTPVTVAVTSECGVTQNYTIDLIRGTCNANNSLSALTTSAGSWNTPFASGTYAYTVNEAWNVSSVDVAATVAAGTSSVTINGTAGATRTITLGAQGSTTTVTVAVTSECGVTQNYVLTCTGLTVARTTVCRLLRRRPAPGTRRLPPARMPTRERGLERELGGRCGNACRHQLTSRSTARPVRPGR